MNAIIVVMGWWQWSPVRLGLAIIGLIFLTNMDNRSNSNCYHIIDAFALQQLPQQQQQQIIIISSRHSFAFASRPLTSSSSTASSSSSSSLQPLSLAMQADKTEIEKTEKDMAIQRGCQFFSIYYDFIDKQKQKQNVVVEEGGELLAPVVILHGGPGIPSNYLRPIQDIVEENRPILYWDQLGCGKSDSPSFSESVYSIDLYVNDLIQLLKEVGITDKFHLYGQSFGGILAFEYLKRCQQSTSEDGDHPECLSVILSSTPTDVSQVENEAQILIDNIISNLPEEDSNNSTTIMEKFRIKHQVQIEQLPQPLQDSYDNAGTSFRGTTSIAGYKAKLDDNNENKIITPVLIMRGEYDFVTYPCIENWKNMFTNSNGDDDDDGSEVIVLKGCSHHGLLEKPNEYGNILRTFWQQNE